MLSFDRYCQKFLSTHLHFMNLNSYHFKLDVFEGPLDLLLFLIKEQKMDIYDIPISEITRQYMAYLDLMQELNLDLAGEYLIMSAELARIKSKTLLPTEPGETDEQDKGEDPRDELTRRLLEYQRYKEAAFELRIKEYERKQIFSRSGPLKVDSEDSGLGDTNVFDLLNSFQKFLKDKKFSERYEMKITTLSVSDRVDSILEILNVSRTVTFQSMFTVLNTKEEVIVTFLGVLELIRLRLVKVEQADQFETIRLYLSVEKEEQVEIIRQYRESEEKNKQP